MIKPAFKIRLATALATAAFCAGNVFAAPLTGVAATDGWTYTGNSRDTTNVIWARNSPNVFPAAGTKNFNSYITAFTLGASDTFTGSGFQGSAGGALISGSWAAGDRIIGLGISSASLLNSGFFKVDFGGTGSWAAAPAVDTAGGFAGISTGGVGSIIGQSVQSSALYAPFANTYKTLASTATLDFSSATRAWAVLAADLINYNNMEWLVNYDELLRLNVPVAAIGTTSKFVVGGFGPVAGAAPGVNEGADVVFSYALVFPTVGTVPEPGSLALVALALIGLGVARRRA